MPHKNYLLLLLLFVFSLSLGAQVRINEYSAANLEQFQDNHNDFEDWIELYNAGSSMANISGYWLSDDLEEPQKFQFPAGTTIEPQGFLRVWCSGRNQVDPGGHYHASFRLTQTKTNPESLVLSQPNGTAVDVVLLEKTANHQSRCRQTDGADTFRICTNPSPNETNNGTVQYAGFAETPTMDVQAGFYTDSVTVAISTVDTGLIIRYTLDGKQPITSSPVYSGPITLHETTVIKARAFSSNPAILRSFIAYNTYFINEDFSLPVFSVAADQLQQLANGNGNIRPVGSIEYFDTTGLRTADSYGELNRHGQDSWVNPQRSLDWISRDEMGYSQHIEEQLFRYTGRDEYQRVIFRAAGDDNYPSSGSQAQIGSAHLRDDYVQTLALMGDMELDVRASERCIVFLNGDYWGVYSVRDNPDDHDFTEYNYDQGKYDIQYLKTWGGTWADYGGARAHGDWFKMSHFILNNDMSHEDNYQKVRDSVNLLSMIDYFTVNLNVVASDWLNYNTGWWRGLNPEGNHKKWGYILWDLDATFDYYINYSGVPNTNPDAVPCDIDQIAQFLDNWFPNSTDTCLLADPVPTDCPFVNGKHEKIFIKLRDESADFRKLYFQRQADLSNTVFSCENMLHVFDSMVAVYAPEMPRHIERWGGSLQEWEQNVATMRDFITQRCLLLDDGMVNCFEVTGPHEVTLLVEPPGAGKIDFNTLDIEEFPWTGNYFGNMENRIEANAKGVLPFLRWESRAGNAITPSVNDDVAAITLTQPDTLVAVFGIATHTWEPGDGIVLNVFPTMATDMVQVDYTLVQPLPVRITLISAAGRVVSEIPRPDGSAGEHSLRLDLNELNVAPGVYLLDFQAGNARTTAKLVVVR